jgi:hypothetical protein
MIRIEEIRHLPEELVQQLSEYAKGEWEIAAGFAQVVFEKSEHVWYATADDRPLLVCGVIRQSLMGACRFWFLLFREVKKVEFKRVKMALPTVFKRCARVETWIEDSYEPGRRFARFFDFEPSETHITAFGREYTVYEARR